MPATKVMKLADVQDGATIEIVDSTTHIGTGRIYKIGHKANHLTGQRYAWERFTSHRVVLHPSLSVIPAEYTVDNEGRWIR